MCAALLTQNLRMHPCMMLCKHRTNHSNSDANTTTQVVRAKVEVRHHRWGAHGFAKERWPNTCEPRVSFPEVQPMRGLAHFCFISNLHSGQLGLPDSPISAVV